MAAKGNFQDPDAYEKLQFYYHPDHLGSSSYITNLDGEVVQHIEYVPFGEVFFEERNNVWNTPYLFNAKEFDEETGLYYYGARYYDPRLSLWMSTDPMQEKYFHYSTYVYCLGNPIILFDPNGLDPKDAIIAVKFSIGFRFGGSIGKFSANIDLRSANYVVSTDGTDSYISSGMSVGAGVLYFSQDNTYKQTNETIPIAITKDFSVNRTVQKEEVTKTTELGIGIKDIVGANIQSEEKFHQIGQSGIVSQKNTSVNVDLIYSKDDIVSKKSSDKHSSSTSQKSNGGLSASVNCLIGVSIDFNYGKLIDKVRDWFSSKSDDKSDK